MHAHTNILVCFVVIRVGRGQADVCVQCLLQIAMNSSPHLDWIVAHIGYVSAKLILQFVVNLLSVFFSEWLSKCFVCRSRFHEVFIPKLLSTALKEYTASHATGGEGGDASVMTPTVVHVLSYLSLQHSQEIKTNLLALFHVSEVKLHSGLTGPHCRSLSRFL